MDNLPNFDKLKELSHSLEKSMKMSIPTINPKVIDDIVNENIETKKDIKYIKENTKKSFWDSVLTSVIGCIIGGTIILLLEHLLFSQ